MEFFNQKEDVIDIELTPFGEYLLSQGAFKPTYYAFYDEDILYDGEYGGIKEDQNNVKQRIKDETPRLRPQAVFKSVAEPIYEHEQIAAGSNQWLVDIDQSYFAKHGVNPAFMQQYFYRFDNIEQTAVEKHYTFPLCLGNSSFDSKEAPAWEVKFLYGSVTESVSFLAADNRAYLKIPQIEAYITYKSFVKTAGTTITDTTKLKVPEYEELHELPSYTDGTTYDFDEDFIILEINEHNVPYKKDNFEIEVFGVMDLLTEDGPAEQLIPLSFVRPPSQTKNGLLMSFEEQTLATEKDLQKQFLDLDDTYIEHWFNVYVDKEIDPELICKVKPVAKQKGLFIDDPLDCADELSDQIPISKIYGVEDDQSLPECE